MSKEPEADYTIRDGIGGVSIMNREGEVVANMRSSGRVLNLFIAGAAASGTSVYDQRTGMYIAGTLDKLSQGLFPHGASEQ